MAKILTHCVTKSRPNSIKIKAKFQKKTLCRHLLQKILALWHQKQRSAKFTTCIALDISLYIEIWCHYAFSKGRKMGGIARALALWHLFHKEHSDISRGRYLRGFLQFFKSILELNFWILRRSKANEKYRSSWLFFIAVNAQCFQKINMVTMP